MKKTLSEDEMRDIVQWDVPTWSKAICYWKKIWENENQKTAKVLDIGARDGGTSLFWALQGIDIICSDLDGPSVLAHTLHAKYNVSGQITYAEADATNLPYQDNSFDIVCFKSVLGGIGGVGGAEAVSIALNEMHRILKPNGFLFFAENLSGSSFHSFLRKHFVSWGNRWLYQSLDLMIDNLSIYSEHHIETFGLFGCLKTNFKLFNLLDEFFCSRVTSKNHYMCYGYARK